MIYSDYAYYTTDYGGTAVSEADFNRLAAKASAFIDKATVDRAKNHTDSDKLKCCCCDLVDTLASCDENGATQQSESIGA